MRNKIKIDKDYYLYLDYWLPRLMCVEHDVDCVQDSNALTESSFSGLHWAFVCAKHLLDRDHAVVQKAKFIIKTME